MASPPNNNQLDWDPDKILRLYLHDYMVKKGMHNTAEIFKNEAQVPHNPVEMKFLDSVIDSPDGFLHEWWSIFYEVFAARQRKDQETGQGSSSKVVPEMTNDAFNNVLPRIPPISMSAQRPQQFELSSSFNNLMAQPSSSLIPSTMYGCRQARPPETNRRGMDDGIDIYSGRDIPRDPLDVMQKITVPLDGPHETKTNQALNIIPPNEWSMNVGDGNAILAEVTARTPENQTSTFLGNSTKCNDQYMKIPETKSSDKDKQNYMGAADGKPENEAVGYFRSFENKQADHRIVPSGNQQRISTTGRNENKGFSFKEVGCLLSSKSKLLSSHFASDGKVLASVGHDKKVFIWSMETFDCITTAEAHSLLVTDVRFRPVRLWDVNRCVSMHVTKGGSNLVRFQPYSGKFLATATRNNIKIVDVETDQLAYHLKGHVKDVVSICWDKSGTYVGSVSEDGARVWSMVSNGKCIGELPSKGNKFQSCIFHPGYPNLLIVGGYQTLEIWNPTEGSKTRVVQAHKGLIAGLADSKEDELIASTSHDQCVKLWK
ncbi:hypothetical protein VNO77_21956 [Canavalia gladiata]|uniref:Uncharacterized protein n=1 Tax=Canavalia gladiata TaxID=3824 RepID=A0AAN9L6W5_CANGL